MKLKDKQNREVLRWIYAVSGEGKLWVAILSLVRIVQGICTVFYAALLKELVDSATLGDREIFFDVLILFIILNAITIVLLYFSRLFAEKAHISIEKNFRIKFFSELMRRDFSKVSKVHSGDWMTRITSDVTVVTSGVSTIVPDVLGMAIRMASALVSLYILIPHIIYALVPAAVVMYFFSRFFRTRLKTYHKNVQHKDGASRSFMQERIMSLIAVHSFSREEHSVKLACDSFDELAKEKLKRHYFTNGCMTVISSAMISAQILGIGFCGWGIVTGALSYGTMSAVIYLINLLESPLVNFSRYINQYYAMLASAERLVEVEEYELDVAERALSAEEIRNFYSNRLHAVGLEGAAFSYDKDGDKVLEDFSIELKKGEFVAFTGPSGCGKSTVFKLLMSLYRLDGGSAYVLDKKGERYPLDSTWRGLFSYVPQGNMLMSGTIREALTFGDSSIGDGQIWSVLDIAVADFVRELPEGLDSCLGEGGYGLSEGQMQRISIARAILSNRPILLLDEATSALDMETEKKLLENLRSMTDRTLVIITHREAALEFCDKTIEFEV